MSRAQFAAILVAGALIRAAALPGAGTPDVITFKVWTYNAVRHGVARMYGVGGSPPERRELEYLGTATVVDYPPLALYELGAAGRLHWLWSGRRFPNNRSLNAVVKLPSMVGDAAVLLLVLAVTRRYFGERAARSAAAVYWLNPASIIDGSVLGYLDLQYVAPAVGAIVAAAHGLAVLAGILIAAAILTKAQGVFIAPAVALAVWACGDPARRRARIASAAGAGFATAAVVVAPVVAAGGWANMLQALSRLAHHDSLSSQACNLWWIVGWALRVRYSAGDMGLWRALTAPARILGIPRVVELGYPDPKIIGAALAIAGIAWALWIARRAPDVWTVGGAAAFMTHAYATLAAQVHENHLFAVVPLLALAASGRRAFVPVLVAMSAIVALNLNMFYGFADGEWAFPRSATIVDASVLLALINCVALSWHAVVLRRECSTAAARLPASAPA